MKATIKATGEIVEIKDLYDDGTALVGNMYLKLAELNFFSEMLSILHLNIFGILVQLKDLLILILIAVSMKSQ